MTIATILKGKGPDVARVAPGSTIADALALLHSRRIGAVLVMDGDVVAGILSERDIVRGLHAVGANIVDHPVSGCMTSPVITVSSSDSLLSALGLMTDRRIRHLPVVDGGRLAGIVSIGDIVKARLELLEAETHDMKAYISAS